MLGDLRTSAYAGADFGFASIDRLALPERFDESYLARVCHMSQVINFAVLYRVRLHSGMEGQYISAWSRVTKALRAERGGLGSRLHRGPEGIWYAYAQWASAEARSQAFAAGPVDAEAERLMQEAIAERLPEIVLEPVANYLLPMQDGT